MLCVSDRITETLKSLEDPISIKCKKGEIKPPAMYLRSSLESKKLNGKECWTMSSKGYVKAAIETLEEVLIKKKMKALPMRAERFLTSNYVPELDDLIELDTEDISFYQELIGILRWAIEIGRVDIHTEVSMLSSYQVIKQHSEKDTQNN